MSIEKDGAETVLDVNGSPKQPAKKHTRHHFSTGLHLYASVPTPSRVCGTHSFEAGEESSGKT